jgi:N-acetylmuramoyl-L-alanine amidase
LIRKRRTPPSSATETPRPGFVRAGAFSCSPPSRAKRRRCGANGLEALFRDGQDKAQAQKLQTALIELTKMRDRKIKQRTDLAVLKFSGTAVLIEPGFIANDLDREKLLNAQMRDSIVRTIADVVIEQMH